MASSSGGVAKRGLPPIPAFGIGWLYPVCLRLILRQSRVIPPDEVLPHNATLSNMPIGVRPAKRGLPPIPAFGIGWLYRSEEHTSQLQSLRHLVCRLLLEKKKQRQK